MKRGRTEDYLQALSASEHRQQSQYQSIVSQIISQFKSCTKITTAFCELSVGGGLNIDMQLLRQTHPAMTLLHIQRHL